MNRQTTLQMKPATSGTWLPASSILQRKCACGQHMMAGGDCAGCRGKQQMSPHFSLSQTKAATTPEPEIPRTNGQLFAQPARTFMDARVRQDFSAVPVSVRQSNKNALLRAGFIGEVTDTPATVPGETDAGTAKGGAKGDATGGAKGGTRRRAGPNCIDICNRAYANSSLNFGGGGVICDGATKCPCVFDVPPLSRGQCPGFDAIVLHHEQQHLTDVDCDASAGLHRPPFRDPSTATASECRHRRTSVAQLNRIIPGASGVCQTGMTSIRDQLNTWITANCGS